jgi:hypothetical protein
VAATLAAALVAFDTFNPQRQCLVNEPRHNMVLVLMLTTAILGPLLTDDFAPRMLARDAAGGSAAGLDADTMAVSGPGRATP